MKVTVGQLRSLIKEQVELQELFGRNDFDGVLDSIVGDLNDVVRKLERAHQLAPQGPGKAIVTGLHSDLFNQVAEFRKYVAQLKALNKR